jgi:hypothetical protein
MADKTNFPNGLNQGEGKDETYKELVRKLETEGRVELGIFNTEILRKYGTLNLAIKKEDGVKVKSGGFEIVLKDNTVEVYREKKVQVNGKIIYEPMHVYVSNCLSKNLKTLLDNLMAEYGYDYKGKWMTVVLPRSDVKVRRLQSWLLAVINGFNVPLHDNPLVC